MIESPCNDVCTTDSESGLCVGCGRTPEEIANWVYFSDKQKERVLKSLENRNKISTNQNNNMLDKRIINMNNLTSIAKKQILPIGLILILALSRLVPHPWNFTPVIAVAIMSGYFFKNVYLSFLILLISMLIADIFLGFYENMIFVYVSLLFISFIFYKFSKKINFKNLFIYGFAGSVVFFIISNFGVWVLQSPGLSGLPYERSLAGLIECYILAIPFFPNTFVSTIIFAYPAIYIYKSLPAWSSTR
tara:strand:+ start:2016 stop:2756 length:741 start_codon:yes stop_codon:yes gene_type:complete